MFKVPTHTQKKKKITLKNEKVSLNRFELDDVSDLKSIDKLVLKLSMPLRV